MCVLRCVSGENENSEDAILINNEPHLRMRTSSSARAFYELA